MNIRYFNIDGGGGYCDWVRDQIVLDEDLKNFSILHDFVWQHEIFHAQNKNKFIRNLKFEVKNYVTALLNPAIYDEMVKYNDYKARWNKRSWKQILIGKIYDFIVGIVVFFASLVFVPVAIKRLKKYDESIYYGFRWLNEGDNIRKS